MKIQFEVIRQYDAGYSLKRIEKYYADNMGVLHRKAANEVSRIIYAHLLSQKIK